MKEYTIKRLFDGELIIQYVDRDCDYEIIGMLIIFILHSLYLILNDVWPKSYFRQRINSQNQNGI